MAEAGIKRGNGNRTNCRWKNAPITTAVDPTMAPAVSTTAELDKELFAEEVKWLQRRDQRDDGESR
jgi:hypothetical protein